ncbi:21872_t:CDS:2, partial [Racocetra persica]
ENFCECDIIKKPSRNELHNLYSLVYNPKTTSLNQELFLRKYNRLCFTYFKEDPDLEYSPTDNDHDDNYSITSDLPNNNLDSSTNQPNNENTFDAFHYDLTKHTCERLKNKKINNYDLEILYKINRRGQLIVLDDEHDFDSFITESKNLSSNKIMNTRDVIVEVLPSYPAFGMAYAIKVNKQLNISQPIFLISDLVPTFYEFFEKLNKAYNDSNDDYLKLEAVFAREKLTVNSIKNLNYEYLKEELEVTKRG